MMSEYIKNNSTVLIVTTIGLWLMFLLWGCARDEMWFPIFNILFVIFACLPQAFGSFQSDGLWGAIGDFTIGIMFISIFGFPTVLHNIEKLSSISFFLIILSNLFLIFATFLQIIMSSENSSFVS